MNNLMIFENKKVEVFEFGGQVLFNPYHVGECLELEKSSVRNYLSKMTTNQAILLKNSNVLNKDIRKLHNTGEKFLTESGVYKLIFKSDKKEAEKFQDWVTDEVLPAIRKTGGYITTTENMSDEDIMARALQIANAKIEERNKQIKELKPKAEYAETILDSKSLLTVTQIAKDYGMGANRFNELLHSHEIQYKKGDQWLLYAKYQNKGYVFSSSFPVPHKNQPVEVKMTTKWTQKGRKFLYDFLKARGVVPTIEA